MNAFELGKIAGLKASVKLQGHQADAVQKSESSKGMILNWGLGSGKTLGAISVAEKRGGNVLVVTPASLRSNFGEQLRKFVPRERVSAYTIISYDKFRRDPDGWINRTRPNTLVADEMHRLRNAKPRQTFESIRHKVPFMLGLTGSLINNHPREIAPLTNLIAGKKVFDSQDAFERRYIDVKKVPPGFFGSLRGVKPGHIESIKNKAELRRKLEKNIHRFTGNVEYKKFLPKVVEEKVLVEMNPTQESMYKALSTRNPALAYRMRHNLPPSKSELKSMNSFMTAARQIMNNPGEYSKKKIESPKFNAQVNALVRGAKKDKNFRAVVYSNFLSSGVEPVVEGLNARGVSARTFTGALNDKDRAGLVSDLNHGRVKVLGLSPAGGEGLDLKGVRVVQLTEEHWNPERGAQAIGRSARFKSHEHLKEKDRKVLVQRFQAVHRKTLMNKFFGTKSPMSADQWIDERRMEKLRLNQAALGAIKEYQ